MALFCPVTGVLSTASQVEGKKLRQRLSSCENQLCDFEFAEKQSLPGVSPVTHVFSTEQLAPEHRFEAFRARINSMFEMTSVKEPPRDGFAGEIRSINLGSLLISSMRTPEFSFARSRPRLLRDFIDHVMIRVDLDREPERGGRVVGVVLIDLGRVTEHGLTPCHNVSIVVPRRASGLSDAHLQRLHGRPLQGPRAMILAEHLVSVMRHAQGIGANDAAALSAITPALLAACIDPTGDTTAAAREDLDIAIISRARAHIACNLRAPELDPAGVAREAGVSRAKLYRLFEPAGGVAKAIREARLNQAMRDIIAKGQDARLGDIGHNLCFSSEAQFSRAFKAYFGFSPRDARGAVVQGQNAVTLSAGSRDPDRLVFRTWLAAL
jgi:AraC-like DNA-binding protein